MNALKVSWLTRRIIFRSFWARGVALLHTDHQKMAVCVFVEEFVAALALVSDLEANALSNS